MRNTCAQGRFYSYDNWRDRIFVPISIPLVWLFVRLGWSGNAVSFLSGMISIIGAILLSAHDPRAVAVGSFGYMLFYLLDYVDGGVARIQGKTGIGGQYIDWVMHVVSSCGFAAGLFAGSIHVAGPWIIPFGICTIIASALTLDRFSLAWFAICMHYQQQRVKGTASAGIESNLNTAKHSLQYRIIRKITMMLFHEDYAIFLLPVLALSQLLLLRSTTVDFRVALILAGGVLYFPVIAYDIWHMASTGKVDKAYRKLFFCDQAPKLPDDHFLH